MTRSPAGHPILWILLFSMLAAAALDEAGGFWIGALCGYLFDRVRQAERRLARLEASSPAATAASTAETPADPPAADPRLDGDEPAAVLPEAAWIRAEPAAVAPPPAAAANVAPSTFERWMERARGGNPLARLGVLITFVGAVYLIRYAAEEGWLPIELRLAVLALSALVMVVTGGRLHARADAGRATYALTLQGGGFALLYLTVLAAFHRYALMTPAAAFGLLAATAAAAAWLAVRQDASLLAMLGFAGGYAAPLLVGGDGGPYVLFAYYTVLDLGALAIVAARGWTRLALMGFVFTFGVTALWRGSRYQPGWFASTEIFLFGYWALFLLTTILAALRDPRRGRLSGTLTFGLPAAVMALQASLVERHDTGLALTSVALGLAYAALAWACHRRAIERPPLSPLVQAFAAISVLLLTLAIPLRYDAELTAATWALEGAGAVWLGVLQGRRRLRAFGIGIQILAGLQLIEALDSGLPASALFAAGVPAGLLVAVAGAFSAVRLRDAPQPRWPGESWVPAWLVLWGLGFWLASGLAQLEHAFPSERTAAGLALAGVTIALLGAGEARLCWRWLAWPARALFAITAFGGLIAALFAHPFDHADGLGWLLLFAGLVLSLRQRAREDASADLPLAATHGLGIAVLTLVLALELDWRLGQWLGGDWPRLAWALVPMALLLLLDGMRAHPPIASNGALYRVWIAGGLAFAVLAWVAVAGFETAGAAGPLLPAWPLLNPHDAVALGGLLLVVRLWRHRDRAEVAAWPAWLAPGLLAAVAFAWANGALVRGLHAIAGTPIEADAWTGSPLLQAGFSLLWSVVGLVTMRAAAARALRPLWLVGAVLMVVVAAKLFVVDTAGTGTLARIAAFLGVGAILLVAGWLAPMPARRSS